MAVSEIIRNSPNVEVSIDQTTMAKRFSNMISNVKNAMRRNGPIYSTWIAFQIGMNTENSRPIYFDTSSTDKKKNLIASLKYKKSCAGTANSMELTIVYDPFDHGQENSDVVEQLDEYVARAMSPDINDDDNLNLLKGYIQYGYNKLSSSDAVMVSPKYWLQLTNAECTIDYNNGLATYVFSGTSIISTDADNVVSYPGYGKYAEEGKQYKWKKLDIVEYTLFKYYGDPDNRPAHTADTTKCLDNKYKYKIDIPEDVWNASIHQEIDYEPKTGMSPINYCQGLLDEGTNCLTDEQIESEKFSNLAEMSYNQRPRYLISVDDANKVIHITHVTPTYVFDKNTGEVLSVEMNEDYQKAIKARSISVPLSWSHKNDDLILAWKPEVNAFLYLIRKAKWLRNQKILEEAYASNDVAVIKKAEDKLIAVNDNLREMYNAQIQIVGIPADPPIGAEVEIYPQILETVSRTAGVYMITGCTDEITNTGIYTTTLELFRMRGFNDPDYAFTEADRTVTEAELKAYEEQKKIHKPTKTELEGLDQYIGQANKYQEYMYYSTSKTPQEIAEAEKKRQAEWNTYENWLERTETAFNEYKEKYHLDITFEEYARQKGEEASKPITVGPGN